MGAVTPPRPLKADDDRAAFDCGRPALNTWFQRHAWASHASGISRTNVICDADAGMIVGYVSLTAAQIERGFLPKAHRRNKPDPITVTLLGQLAVVTTHQGQGHAKSLLAFALRSAVAAADHVGSYAVITHPLDDGVRAFYARFHFEDLPTDPKRAMFVRISELAAAGFAA
ncbi:MAG TPA: GNAT family N-acetyltransferase [Hyphomicrobiaceae bacterium]|nr:GNAT family N-acetyltransferase [Hyphomicrobiaceae bacterium]